MNSVGRPARRQHDRCCSGNEPRSESELRRRAGLWEAAGVGFGRRLIDGRLIGGRLIDELLFDELLFDGPLIDVFLIDGLLIDGLLFNGLLTLSKRWRQCAIANLQPATQQPLTHHECAGQQSERSARAEDECSDGRE